MKKECILSGITPSGELTLGNYIGALQNWERLYHADNSHYYGIMNLHAITTEQSSKSLLERTLDFYAFYQAMGLDNHNSIIFVQSMVPAHSELAWILNCYTPMGWLNRMTQYKDKINNNRNNEKAGLYSYPTLMAADILLYHASKIPVGDDQKQHIEFTRDLAGAFNRAFAIEYFTLPEPIIQSSGARIMSLNDVTKKMSKSASNDNSKINLSDSADLIKDKIRKATTDSISSIYYDKENRPEISNLLDIYCALGSMNIHSINDHFVRHNTSQFKNELADLIISCIMPLQNKMNRIRADREHLERMMHVSSNKANEIANNSLQEIRKIVGLL